MCENLLLYVVLWSRSTGEESEKAKEEKQLRLVPATAIANQLFGPYEMTKGKKGSIWPLDAISHFWFAHV